MIPNDSLSIPNALKRERPDDYYKNTATIRMAAWAARRAFSDPSETSSPRWSSRTAAKSATPRSSCASWSSEGWLMHYLNFSGERILPSIPKLLDQPFWLDPSDPHRMASVMQVASRPLGPNYTSASGDLGHDRVYNERGLGEGDPSHRDRERQPRAGGRRGDRPRQADPGRVAGTQPWWHVHPSSGCMGLRHCHKVRWCTRRAGAPRPTRSNSTPLTVGCPRAGEGRGGRTCVRPR